MGADLYLNSVRYGVEAKSSGRKTRKAKPARAQVEDEVYFRDSYNATSVLWTLGLSWWRDVLPLLDANSELSGAALRHFRQLVALATQQLPTAEDLSATGLQVEHTGFRTLDGLHRYHIEKRKRLLRFLDFAILHDCGITCSL